MLVFTQILIVSVYAELNQKLMEQYWETSRAQGMFKLSQKGLKKDLFKATQLKKEDKKPLLLKEINTFIRNPKYIEAYKKIFFSIDDIIYKDLIKFYNTTLGKKYSRLSISVDWMDSEEVKQKYKKIMKDYPLSMEKLKLISDIDKELNLIELKVDWQRNFIFFQKRVLYPDNNFTDAMIDRAVEIYKKKMKEYEPKLMSVLFYKFSEEELKEILKYASSKILAIEVEYIYKAILEFTKLSYMDLKKDYKRLAMISYCQRFSTSSAFIPEDCKTEWLND